MQISKAAIDLIIAEEVGSRQLYEQKYRHPEWPGTFSGVTIGIGYDVGQNDETTFRTNWKGIIPDDMLDALVQTCGITGMTAKPLARMLHDRVDIPWNAAFNVFTNCTLPRYSNLVRYSLPNVDLLTPDCFGALTSLVLNRGASFNEAGARYAEMRAIKAHMLTKEFHRIPNEIRAMRRLWPHTPGLLKRREREATLFERGLKPNQAVRNAAIVAGTATATSAASGDWRIVAAVGVVAILAIVAFIIYNKVRKV